MNEVIIFNERFALAAETKKRQTASPYAKHFGGDYQSGTERRGMPLYAYTESMPTERYVIANDNYYHSMK
ncbi:hypothetical protein ACFFL1_01780 [Samsonia erythrinae]|uniref:hypothetical protein n=1 Tax=Samsonia erythrinae TaxID=160434 RepID=UPI00104A0DEC|nr:hypothetical protein [Samsonia erythrinae]